jgi:hypothetical protein
MAPVLHFILTFKIGRSFHGAKRCSSAGYACVPSTRWDWVTDTPPFGIKQISRGTSHGLFFFSLSSSQNPDIRYGLPANRRIERRGVRLSYDLIILRDLPMWMHRMPIFLTIRNNCGNAAASSRFFMLTGLRKKNPGERLKFIRGAAVNHSTAFDRPGLTRWIKVESCTV